MLALDSIKPCSRARAVDKREKLVFVLATLVVPEFRTWAAPGIQDVLAFLASQSEVETLGWDIHQHDVGFVCGKLLLVSFCRRGF